MSKPKSDGERRKKADQRKRDAGLVRVSVWVPESEKNQMLEHARKLVNASKEP